MNIAPGNFFFSGANPQIHHLCMVRRRMPRACPLQTPSNKYEDGPLVFVSAVNILLALEALSPISETEEACVELFRQIGYYFACVLDTTESA